MMKPYSIVAALMLFAMNAAAQSGWGMLDDPRTIGKTTNTESRLLGGAVWVAWEHGMRRQDSIHLTYNEGNGWDTLHKEWKFDTALIMWEGYSPHQILKTFDAQKRVSTRQMDEFDTTAFKPYERLTYLYDAQGRIAGYDREGFNGTNWRPGGRSTYTYNAQGQITVQASGFISTGVYIPYSRITNAYNAQGQIVDSMLERSYTYGGNLHPYERIATDYNANGMIERETRYGWDTVGKQWHAMTRTNYDYPAPLITTSTYEYYDTATWKPLSSATIKHNAKGQEIETEWMYWDPGYGWRKTGKALMSYDINGNRISSESWSLYGTTYKPDRWIFNRYNSFGQLTFESTKTWDNNLGNWNQYADYEARYYYGPFNTGVKEEVVETQTLLIYPNPATNALTLDLKWNEQQHAAIKLFDVMGKVICEWNMPDTSLSQTLDVSNIPSGTYMLKVMGTKGVLSQQVSIMK